ncbi:nacrein-like protein [Ostrea edulis]|uniref:nacrein-like protein n=1 Tax=Ostrea edulis TaxID=37623 RepID=UPI0024AF80D7|nr:nacrein-like protein [Ostrea edulis]
MEICTACWVGFILVQYSLGHNIKYPDMFKEDVKRYCREENCNLAQYSYHRNSCQGPNFWSRITPCWGNCSSFHQSPVNIITEATLYRPYGGLKFSNLCERVAVKLVHKGHSPHFKVTGEQKTVLCNVPHRGTDQYVFVDVHVHIGRKKERGSEHAMNDVFYPMEAHLVFVNDKYRTFQEARTRPGGLVVIAIMIEIDEDRQNRRSKKRGSKKHRKSRSCGNTDGCKRKSATVLSHLMKKYYAKIGKVPVDPKNDVKKIITVDVRETISLNDLLPYDLSYYTYHGSLTTPPCYETVQWIVMRCPIILSRKAYKALATVPDTSGHPLSKYGTRRPLQRGIIDHPAVFVERNFRCSSKGNRRNVC